MGNIALIVEYELHPGKEADFAARLREHGKRTREEEPGCLRFDVTLPIARDGTHLPGKVILNELYADLAALDAHEKSPRLAAMREANAPFVKSRKATLTEVL